MGGSEDEPGLLVDLNVVSLESLRRLQSDEFLACTNGVLKQVDRPRFNIGSSGPPGRAD